ncbi:molybdopterin-dependent oxidoreductase [Pseudotabrizicola algicola]|uniref:Molybdopterin-dependent oxidoreductase n=1 Tax=Pseudotabrizicola algicola TaxID=2709381 RepID=A0A6B3RID7_9RHOB|nr:molybdopterin-dependent oxidoreductase [Pseudotabrizicola algicola]NEX45807.1 molybdopterin-dependent oxidoreductase [Pseudotabrizicola algicola]
MHLVNLGARLGRAWALSLAVVAVLQATAGARAEPLAAPAGDVILTVHGQIAHSNGAQGAALDRELLKSFGVITLHTSTIWTDGTSAFEGVELAALLEHLGASGSVLRLVALNEYAVELPMSEAVPGGPLLAFRMDGKDLSPRDKGPLWMIYPYDTNPAYKNEVSYSRSIWQLTSIEVLP